MQCAWAAYRQEAVEVQTARSQAWCCQMASGAGVVLWWAGHSRPWAWQLQEGMGCRLQLNRRQRGVWLCQHRQEGWPVVASSLCCSSPLAAVGAAFVSVLSGARTAAPMATVSSSPCGGAWEHLGFSPSASKTDLCNVQEPAVIFHATHLATLALTWK